jgi:hypothetical protein
LAEIWYLVTQPLLFCYNFRWLHGVRSFRSTFSMFTLIVTFMLNIYYVLYFGGIHIT